MESVLTAAKDIFRRLAARCGKTLRRWSLKQLRNLLWRVDEWVMKQESRLRDEAAMADTSAVALAKAEVDPVTSAQREKSHRHRRVNRGLSRLKYQNGEFVRREYLQ